MVYGVLSLQNFKNVASLSSFCNQTSSNQSLLSSTYFNNRIKNKKDLFLASVASPFPHEHINTDYLQREFSGQGVTFKDIGTTSIAELELANGSTATLVLLSGVISSYKVPVWHGGKVELLHTAVSEGDDGGAVIQGGVSLDVNFGSDYPVSWPPRKWVLRDVRGNPEDSVQIELISSEANSKVEMKYITVLTEETLTSEFTVVSKDSNSSPISLQASILSHLTVSTPEATYAVGLEGSNFIDMAAFPSRFCIIPDDEEEAKSGIGQTLGHIFPRGQSSGLVPEDEKHDGEQCEEKDNYKQLDQKMSRAYTSAPQYFTVIDRGRRSSLVVGRKGFEEVYMMSPGSRYEWYSKYSFVCIGQSTFLNPITLGPGSVWRGVQHLHNPNL